MTAEKGGVLRDLGPPVLAFVVLAGANLAVIPWFEFPDEANHIHYAQYVAREGHAPPRPYAPTRDGEGAVRVGFNPPLYYAVASLFLAPGMPYVSPRVHYRSVPPRGYPDPPNGGWDALEDLPARLVRLRCLSIAFGLVTLLACWGIGRSLAPEDPRIAMAMAWVPASIPQFVSMSAAINNEGMAIALSSLAALGCARSSVSGRRSTAGLAGLLLGAAALTKVSVLALAPAVFLGIARGRARWKGALFAAAATLLVAGPWLTLHWIENGDPTGIRSIEAVEAHRLAGAFPHDPSVLAHDIPRAIATFFLSYGQVAIYAPAGLYLVPAAAVIAALAGWRRARRERFASSSFTLASWLALACLACAFVAYNVRVYSPQGRYVYVGMSFFSYLAAAGLLAWVPAGRRSAITLIVGVGAAAAQLAFLLLVVGPAYSR